MIKKAALSLVQIIPVVILLSVLTLSTAYGQGKFLERGTSGFMAYLTYGNGSEIDVYGPGMSVSIRSIIDLGFELGWSNNSDIDANGSYSRSNIVVNLLQEGNGTPLAISFFTSITGRQFTSHDLTITSRAFGFDFYKKYKLGTKYGVMPSLAVLYNSHKSKVGKDDEEVTDKKTKFMYSFRANFNKPTGNDYLLFVEPGIDYFDGKAEFLINAGFLLSVPF